MALGRKCTVYGMLMKIFTTEGGERKGYSGVYLRLQYEELSNRIITGLFELNVALNF